MNIAHNGISNLILLQGVSCVNSSFCVVVTSDTTSANGQVITYDGSTWSSPSDIDPSYGLTAVSCPAVSFCAATDVGGNVLIYNGSTWSPSLIDAPNYLNSVSCPTTSFCAAVDGSGNAITFTVNGTVVSNTTVNSLDSTAGFNSISCTSSSFCEAVGRAFNGSFTGVSWTYTDLGGWKVSSSTDITNSGGVNSVSCDSSSFCVAVDGTDALTYDGKMWSAPTTFDSGGGLASVSCANPSSCGAVDNADNGYAYNGTSWSVAPRVLTQLGNQLVSISCPSEAFCVAVDNEGLGAIYTGPSVQVKIAPSPLPATSGSVSYKVTVSGPGATPTGSVQVTDDQGGSCSIATLDSSGSGSCSLSESASLGPYNVTASYSGDSNNPPEAAVIAVSASVSAGGTAGTGSNQVTATATGGANGVDTLTESQYGSDPVGNLNDGSNYFDVAGSIGNTFTSAVVQDCGSVTPSTAFEWWDPTANGGSGGWSPIVGHPGPTYSMGPPGCWSFTLDASSSPTVHQLIGTVFAAVGLPPGAPTAVRSTSGSTTGTTGPLAVTFSAPASNGGSAISGYTAACTSSNGGVTETGSLSGATAAPITVAAVTTAKTYRCTVTATNGNGNGAASAPSGPVVLGSPATPTGVKALSGSTTTSTGTLTVIYALGATNGSAVVSETTTCRSSNGGATKAATHSGVAAPITVSGVTTAKSYNCTVAATNARGMGLASAPSLSVVVGSPSPPTGVTATHVASGQIKVAFHPGNNNGATISGYTAKCTSTNGGAAGSKAGAASPITVTGLTTGKSYTCMVTAKNPRGTGLASSPSGAATA